MANDKMVKIAVISGASEALKYKAKNPHASDSEVLSHITKNMKYIIDNIDQ
ncbi:MAG TPA: hypothetical protein VJH92_04365 [Candidatus Nanoarchaeia archaeon]|nr:hypothetical protein [Candidatus Nanoarchaeia archaeon]